MGEVSNSFFDKLLSGEVALSLVEEKTLGPSLGRGSAFARFNPNAWDGDGDGLVQEGTAFERPAIPGINTDLPNVPKVPQVPVSNNKEVLIYDEISGSSRSMRAGINTARFPRLKRRNKRNPDLDIPQIIKEKTGTVDDGEASKRLSIQLKNLESQFTRGVITVEEYNMQRLASLSEYNYERSIEQSATKAGIEIPREISGIGATGEDGNVVGFVNLIRFSSMHNGIRYLHNSGDDEMLPGTGLNETDQYVGRRYPGELRTEAARTLEDMNEEYEELLQQLRDGRGWDAPLEVSIGFSFEQEIEILRESAGSQLTNQSFKNELYLENEEIPKYLAGIAYSMERALSEQVGGENFEGKIDIAVADRIAKLLSKSWVMKDSYKELNPHWGEIYDFNMSDIFSPEERIPGLPYFHPSGLGESGKNLDTAFMFPFDKDGADIPVVIKRGLRVHEQRTFLTGGKEFVLTRYFFDTHRPEVFETEVVDNPLTSGEGKRRSNDRKLRWEFFPNTEQPKFQVGKIEGPVSKSMGVTLLLDRNTRYGAGSSMDLRVFPFRITQDGIPYRFEPSFSIDEQPAIKRINEFLKKIGIPETRASNTDSLYVPSEFDPRYLVVNGPLETPGKTEERPKSYLDKLREAAARDRGESADLKIDVDMASALLKKQSIRQTDDEETVSVWVSEELVADNASIDASRREPQTPPSITPPKKDMAQRIREGKIRKNLGLSDDEEIPPGYGGDNSRSKRNTDISTGDFIGDEELDPDLKYYINDSNGFPVLQHPLVYAVPYMPQLNNMYNRQYLAKKEQLANALDTGDWDGYVYLHERPYRLDALLEISDDVDDATFWSLLSGIWTDSENIRQNQEIWNEIFDSGRDGMENMMKDEERDALAALPKKIKIYQGHTGDRDDGWSWTTDEKVALWFALRFSKMEGSEAQVTEATVDKDNVLAYLLGRGESEILTSPEDVVIDVTESAKDFQERTGTPNTYDGRSLSKRVNSLLVDSLTITEFIDDFNQNDKDSSKLAESLGIDSTEPVDKLIHNLVNLGLIKDVPSFDSSRSKRSDNKSADKERALKRFMMLSDDEVVALFKENDGSGTNVRVSLGNPNEKEFYARIEKMEKSGIIFPERKVKEKNDENVGSSSRSKKEIYSFTPESDIAEQIKDRKEVKKKASKEIGRITASTRKREEIREIISRIEEKIKSLSDITDSSALSEHEDEIDALSIELQSMLNNITSFIPTNRGRFKPYVSVYGRTAFSDEPSSSHLEIRFDYLTESAESGSWPSRTMYGDLYIASDGEKFIRKSASMDNGITSSSIKIHVDTEQYFDAFQNLIFSAMGVKKFKQEASSPRAIFYAAFDGLHWADERSKEDFLKAVEWISKQKSIEMSADKRKELARLIKIARSQKLDSPNAFKPEIFLRDYDAINALGTYQRAEFEGRADDDDDAYMSIDFTGDIISPDDTSGDGYYFGESSDGSSRSKRKKISLERRKKLTDEAEKLSAPYRPSTRQREEIRTKMDEVRNNVKYYKENPEELNDFIYDIFTRNLKPDEDLEEQFIINLDGKDYELFFGTDVSIDSRTGNLEITLVRIPEGAVDGESVLGPGVYKIQIDDNGNMTTVKDVAEIGDMVSSLVMLRGEGELGNFTKLNKTMNLVEESILSAMGINSFTQNATAYRGESGSMRTGISLSLAEGRTFADKEGKEIFLKIIDSITKNTEIDSDTRARLKALHDRAKKNNLGVNNAVQPQDFIQGSLSENYDLEKGIRDFLNDEKNGMRMLSIDFVKKIDSPDVYRFGGDSSRSIKLRGRDSASVTPEKRKLIRERAERKSQRISTRKREEIALAVRDIQGADNKEDRLSAMKKLSSLIKAAVEREFEIGSPEFMWTAKYKLLVSDGNVGWIGDGVDNKNYQGIVLALIMKSMDEDSLIEVNFSINYQEDGSIFIRKLNHLGDGHSGRYDDSIIDASDLRLELVALLDIVGKDIASALGAEKIITQYKSNAKPKDNGDITIFSNGITFAAENNLDWFSEVSKEKFLEVFESALGPDSFLSDVQRKELRKLIDRSRKEKFDNPNNVRPINFMRLGIDTDRLFAEHSVEIDYPIRINFTEKLPDGPDVYRFGGDSSRSERDSPSPKGFIHPEEFKSQKEKAEREYWRYSPSSAQLREFERITKEISAMLADIKDEDDEVKFFDSELLNELRELLKSSFGKYLYGDEVIKLEFMPNGYLGFNNQFIFPIVATTVSPSLGRGYPSNIRNIVFGTMYINSDGNIWFSAKESHGHITDSMGEMSASSLIYREFMNINNRSKQLARDEVFTENIIKAIGAKSVRKIFTSNRYFPPYSGDGDGIYGDGITFAAEQDYYWGDENQKEIFLDLIQKIIDSTENTSRVNEETKKRLLKLVLKSRKEEFGKPNTVRPKDLIRGYDSRDEIFWAEYGRDLDARNRGGSVSIFFAPDVKPTSDNPYYFGGDSSRSIRLRGRDTASLTPETRRRIRERAERNTAMRLPSTRQRKEINSIANEISELQKMGTDEDRAFGIFIDEDMRNKVEDATRKLGELIEESIIGKMTINGQPVKLEVSLGKYRPIMDGSIQQDVVMFIRSDDDEKSKLLSRQFGIIFKKDGSISIRKNDDAGDSTIENGDLGSWKNQEMRTELSVAMKNIEKNIASAIGAKTMTARHYSSADRDEFDVANVVITANGVSFAADSDFDWATEEDKQKFLDIIEWSADWLSTARPGRWGELSEEKSNELKNLVEKSRKEKFGNHNAIRPSKFSNAINLSDLLARYSLRSGKAINIDFTEKLPDGPDVYRFGGDSSRSKRSLEIVEFNAPAPSKKQIKAIGELKNIVSDDRKDYRLFSDEEGNVPKQIFDGSFEINGEKYSSQIDKSNIFVSQVTDGSVEKTFKFSGKVLDKDGNEVASFSRGIKFVDGRPVHVTHDGLYVRYASQNIGISTALNARNEKLYREIGVPKIVVNATSSGDGKVRGITHWLRNGYSWDDSASRKLILNIIDKALTEGAIKDKEQESAVRKIRESIRENIANLNDDINLEDLVNWDGVDEWFMSYADSNDEYERGKTLYANLSKNLIPTNPSVVNLENSSRSKKNPEIEQKYLKIAERINSATKSIEDSFQITQVETEQEMDDLRSIWEKSKKEVKSLKKEITDSKDTDDLKEFNMTYKRFEEASRMIDKALDPYYLSPYTRSRGDKSWVEHFVIHDGGKYGGIFGGVASVRWAPLTETIYIDFMGSTPLLMPGIGTALYGKILKWGRDMGAKKYVSGALPGSLSFWEEMGMTRSDKYNHSFEDNGLIPMVYEDNGIGMIDKLN